MTRGDALQSRSGQKGFRSFQAEVRFMKQLPLLALLLVYCCATARGNGDVRAAVEKGLRRLQAGAANYVKNATCFSCHHQFHALTVLPAAKKRGFTIDEKLLQKQISFTLDTFRPQDEEIRKGRAIPG